MRYRSYYFDNETDYYYLQSRYYDPNIGRFINADEAGILELTKGEAVGYNLFAYCANDPVNNVDPSGYFPGDLFSNPNEAVKDFAYNYYNVSLFILMEISSIIYTIKRNGKWYYSYIKYSIGSPHSCQPLTAKRWIPIGGWIAGVIHTHPNSNSFSQSDKNFAKQGYLPIYVITPNMGIRVYHDTRRGWKDELIYSNIKPKSLSKALCSYLAFIYRPIWRMHIMTECGFNCRNKRWPSW